MFAKFKPLAGQVIVVTAADSGLGLEVARLAAKAGAAVVLAGGDEPAVRRASDEIGKAGGRAHPIGGDTATAKGCDRVARAATARFGRIDSWIEASGERAPLAHAAQALVGQLGDREARGALVAFGHAMDKAARAVLRRARGKVAATLIRLPKDWRYDGPAPAAAQAALYAVTRPMGQMAVSARGAGLTAVSRAKKHPGLVVGVGLLALAGVVVWAGRGWISQAAIAARPRLARALQPAVIGAVRHRPAQVAKLAAKHPRLALKLAKALRWRGPSPTTQP